MSKEKTLSVSAIKQGTVIDHIRPQQALKIIRLLKFADHENRVTVGLNLKSQSMGLKDLIKIENVFLTETQAAQIAIFSPAATVVVIENYQVKQKFSVSLPETVENVWICPNLRCITRTEPFPTFFLVEENNRHIWLRCRYCEMCFSRDEMQENLPLIS